MKISDITAYLIQLERKGFTGQVSLNFHNGNVCARISKKETILVKDHLEIDEGFSRGVINPVFSGEPGQLG